MFWSMVRAGTCWTDGAPPGLARSLGVGVAIVKLLVEQRGGAVQADSAEGQGTTVVVLLPRCAVDDYLL